jgi:hypothetical protein
MNLIICGYCYRGNTVEEHGQYCPFKKGSRWDVEHLYAPNSCRLKIETNDWIKNSAGRWTIKEYSHEQSITS